MEQGGSLAPPDSSHQLAGGGCMSKVLVMESTYDTCAQAVERAFATFPVNVRGKKVVVKVNALKASDPDREAMVTHYKLLKAVLEKLEDLEPAEIIVGDSGGTESYGKSGYVFSTTRLAEAAGPYYRNLSLNLAVVELEQPFRRKVAVLRDVLEADVCISLPKMKTHGLTMISGGVKNNFGMLAGAQKSWYHYNSVDPEVFARILVEMYRLRRPDLVIMDAIHAMEGYGPASPESRWVNKVLAATDAVAMDTVQAHMVGFSVNDVPYLRLARDLGLGETDLRAIEIIGNASTIEGYKRPTPPESTYSYQAGVGGGRASREFFKKRVTMRPVFTAEKCKKECTACIDGCPAGALARGEYTPILDSSKCMLCSSCKEACAFEAVDLIPDEQLMALLA